MTLLNSVVDFLRAGYPEGVPRQDYVPLLALLRRQLTDEEVAEVARTVLGSHDPADEIDRTDRTDQAVRAITHEEPLQSDLARVAARLASAGWPLASLPPVS